MILVFDYLRVLRASVLLLFFRDFFNDRRDVDSDRTNPDTAAATGAECLAEFIVVVFELVHDAVAVPFGLQITRVVSRGVVGEFPEAAGIPVLSPFACFLGSFVNDVEAVAGRADKGAGAATDTAYGNAIPERIFKVTVQPTFDLL